MTERNDNPLVTIIIPTYNYALYLGKALRSCISQNHSNLEIIVIDDGSTDNTREVVQGFYDDRIRYHYQENRGVSASRNRGIELAQGKFVAFLDADEFLTDDSIETRLAVMLDRYDIHFVLTAAYSVDNKGTLSFRDDGFNKDIVSDRLCERFLLKRLPYTTSAVLMRADRAKQFEFPCSLDNGEDIVYFSKVFFETKGCFLAKPTAVSFSHSDSLRHNLDNLKDHGMGLVEAIFDDPYFQGRLGHIRKRFTADRCFELFRRFFRSEEKTLARKYYRQAVSLQPWRVLKLDYLVKYFRTYR